MQGWSRGWIGPLGELLGGIEQQARHRCYDCFYCCFYCCYCYYRYYCCCC